MYETFKKEVLSQLNSILTVDQLICLQVSLDKVAQNYVIEKANTLPDIYGSQNMELLKTYLICRKIEGYAEGTLINYKSSLALFFEEIHKPYEKLTANDIRVYLYRYKEKHQVSDRSLDKIRQHISAFFRWAFKEGYITTDIADQLKPIKHDVTPRIFLTQIQLEYVRRACLTNREKALVEFLYSTGCRAAELATCKITDVDFNSGTVHLLGKNKKHRISYINAKCSLALQTYLNERTDKSNYLFVGRAAQQITSKTVELWIRKINDRVQDEIHVHITPHVFRHTTATTALSAGMQVQNIQKLLGHANIATTMIYADINQDHVRSEHTRCVV